MSHHHHGRPPGPRGMSINGALIEDITMRGNQGRVTISYGVPQWNQMIVKQLLVLIVDERTRIFGSFGQQIRLRDLQRGMIVDTFVSPNFTRSNPPQTVAFSISVIGEQRYPTRIENILRVDTRNQVVLTGSSIDPSSQIRFLVTDETEIIGARGNRIPLSQLRPGQTVLIAHENFMTMSIPPQTVAIRIEVLP